MVSWLRLETVTPKARVRILTVTLFIMSHSGVTHCQIVVSRHKQQNTPVNLQIKLPWPRIFRYLLELAPILTPIICKILGWKGNFRKIHVWIKTDGITHFRQCGK